MFSETHPSRELRIRFEGANKRSVPVGEDPESRRSNFFYGNDSARWLHDVRHFRKVLYAGLYPGIDAIFYGNGKNLEYDFVVHPGADLGKVRLRLSGADTARLDPSGDLRIMIGSHTLLHRKAHAYQRSVQGERLVPVTYRLEDSTITFQTGSYDSNSDFVIDPAIEYSTLLGGNGDDTATGVAVDSAGNAYVVGYTSSQGAPPFPASAGSLQPSYGGATDAFVAKLSADGNSIVYATYLGGAASDYGYGIAVDPNGNAVVTGTTSSTNFPTSAGAYQLHRNGPADNPYLSDAFVAKLNSAGNQLVFSTYLGGTSFDTATSLALDSSSSVYVAGYTDSTDFPTVSGSYRRTSAGPTDVFAAKLNALGTQLIYATYLGGSATDQGFGIAVDASGAAYVVGKSASPDFPTTTGALKASSPGDDAFVTKINPAGSALVFSTYLGGSRLDSARAVTVNADGQAHVTGSSNSLDFPTTSNAARTSSGYSDPSYQYYDAFLAKLNAAGSGLLYSTYLGGYYDDEGLAVVLDAGGGVYVGGWTASADFPVTPDAMFPQNDLPATYRAGFATLISSAGALTYSTYLYGPGMNTVSGIGSPSAGILIAAGVTGAKAFPATPGAVQTQPSAEGPWDSFLARLNLSSACAFTVNPATIAAPSPGLSVPLSVSGAPGCKWVASPSVDWIQARIDSSSQATITVKPNDELSRSGHVFVAGKSIPVNQIVGCAYTLGQTTVAVNTIYGGPYDVWVNTGGLCPWTASTSAPWITIQGGNPVTSYGASQLMFLAGITYSPTPRTANISVAGQTLTVQQIGTPCVYSLSATSVAFPPMGGQQQVVVSTQAGCPWDSKTTADWLTTGPAESGPGVARIDAAFNAGAPRQATIMIAGQPVTITQTSPLVSQLAIFNPAKAAWYLDQNGSLTWDGTPTDRGGMFGMAGDVPVPGDWIRSGVAQIGVFRNGAWYLDLNNNLTWDGPAVDRQAFFGAAGFVPVVGDWNGDGNSEIGVFNPANAAWYLDWNGNGVWDGPGVDKFGYFGVAGFTPVVGDWNGDGKTDIGAFNPANGAWYLDANGNYSWDGTPSDRTGFFGMAGFLPVVGDWNGDGKTKVGVFNPANGAWYLDTNNNINFDGPANDLSGFFGVSGFVPVVGDWTGDGKTKVGVFNPANGAWYLDKNANLVWDSSPLDSFGFFGASGMTPVPGRW